MAVVHNGIIDNYQSLRARLRESGHEFTSETDTEVVPHLIEAELAVGADPERAFRAAIEQLSDPPMEPSSETGYRTTVRALVVSLSSEGVDLDWLDSELQAALSVLLDRIEVTEATFSFEDGTVDATLSMEEETPREL